MKENFPLSLTIARSIYLMKKQNNHSGKKSQTTDDVKFPHV